MTVGECRVCREVKVLAYTARCARCYKRDWEARNPDKRDAQRKRDMEYRKLKLDRSEIRTPLEWTDSAIMKPDRTGIPAALRDHLEGSNGNA